MSNVRTYSVVANTKGEGGGVDIHLFSVAEAAIGVIKMVNGLKQIEAGK